MRAESPIADRVRRAPVAVDKRSLRTSTAEVSSLIALAIAYSTNLDAPDANWLDVINFYGPLALTAIMLVSSWRMLRLNPSNIWSPLLWFRISTGLYFGFGQLTTYFMNDASKLYLVKYYAPIASEILILNLIVTGGIISVLLGAEIASHIKVFSAPKKRTRVKETGQVSINGMRRLGLMLLLPGAMLNYLIVIPTAMGWTTGTVPGILQSLSSMTLGGIYLLTLWSLKANSRAGTVAITVFMLSEMIVGLLLMTKYMTMLPLLIYLMAVLAHRVTIIRGVFASGCLALLFWMLVPMVSHARDEIGKLENGREAIGIVQRFELALSYYNPTSQYAPAPELQGGLVRLNYSPVATFLIAEQDAGRAGTSLELIGWLLVPRLIWPEKPIMDHGRQISIIYSGNEQNAVGGGLYAESYWLLGWTGVPILLGTFGLMLGLLSQYSLRVISDGRFLYFPVVMLAMQVGMGMAGAYVAQLGGVVQVIGLHFFIAFIERFSRSFFGERRSRHDNSYSINSL